MAADCTANRAGTGRFAVISPAASERSFAPGSAREMGANRGRIEKIVTEFALSRDQYRDPFVVARQEHRVGVDVQHLQIEFVLAAQGLQRGLHVVTEVAVCPAVERQAVHRSGPRLVALI